MIAAVSPWAYHAHVPVWTTLALALALWFWALRRAADAWKPATEPMLGRRQRLFFGLGFAALWLGADWPVHDIAEKFLVSVHMSQHLLFSLIAPPLLLLSVPGWFYAGLAGHRVASPVLRRVARPLVAGLAYNAFFVATHAPQVVDASVRNEPLHFALHTGLFVMSLLLWFPVVNRTAGLPTMAPAGRMLYLFLQSVIPTVPASFLTFAKGTMYKAYAEAPRIWGVSIVEDQQMAGAVMKVFGGTLLWGVIIVTFFRWYGSENRDKQADVLTWDDVERQLAATPAPKEV